MADDGAPVMIVETDPDLASFHLLEEWLYELNVKITGITDGKLLSIFLRKPDGAVIGGTHGWTWAGRCYVRLLYVPPDLRGRGCGTRLMQAVEQEARARGCHEIVLHTHVFQAPEFYRKLGFTVSGRQEFPRGHQFFEMVKVLRSADASAGRGAA
ncbi:MAG: GNAT family N-acetyltransferase [Alphaproteobacteria bacterium]|nr:GNAT family N-acetyltransferase [Alphaproteobacteria bacterium]